MSDTATATREDAGLLDAVRVLRDSVARARFPVAIAAAATADSTRSALLHQLDDYVLPRLTSLEAPLLAVVGGSTGAGKSTLVNSLVGEQVTRPGVLRPTTRSPVLVHHPLDEHWFADDRVLPDLDRVRGLSPDGAKGSAEGPRSVRLVASAGLPCGLALLDAPDIDSVVEANRTLSRQLLSAADLWLFVTTAARYADAVPWALLRQAQERGTAVAVVLDRVPADAVQEIYDHLAEMLHEEGLVTAPVFTVIEGPLDGSGMLPDDQVTRLRGWLTTLAQDQQARADVVRQTLSGALDSLEGRVRLLADASDAQQAATTRLAVAAQEQFDEAVEGVVAGMSDGTLLRGEVLARWQEFVGTGEFFRQLESTVSRWRDSLVAAVKGAPAPAHDLGEALHSGVAELVRAEGLGAISATGRSWRSAAGGPDVLDADPALTRPSTQFQAGVDSLVHDWQGDVLRLVRSEGRDRRTTARVTAYGVNAVGTVLILVTMASTAGLTGAEVGIAGGTAVVGQKLLEAIFGDQAVRSLAVKARSALIERVRVLYASEGDRFRRAVEEVEVPRAQGRELVSAALAVRAAR